MDYESWRAREYGDAQNEPMPILNVSLDLKGSFQVVDQSQVNYDIQFQNLSLQFDVGVDGGPANNASADSNSITAITTPPFTVRFR
jgi:hypothetical protein